MRNYRLILSKKENIVKSLNIEVQKRRDIDQISKKEGCV